MAHLLHVLNRSSRLVLIVGAWNLLSDLGGFVRAGLCEADEETSGALETYRHPTSFCSKSEYPDTYMRDEGFPIPRRLGFVSLEPSVLLQQKVSSLLAQK